MPLLRKHKYHRFYGEAIFQREHRIFYAFKAPAEWHLNLVDIRNGATWPLGKVRDGTLMGLTKRSCYIHGETWVEFRRKVLEMWKVEIGGQKCYDGQMKVQEKRRVGRPPMISEILKVKELKKQNLTNTQISWIVFKKRNLKQVARWLEYEVDKRDLGVIHSR